MPGPNPSPQPPPSRGGENNPRRDTLQVSFGAGRPRRVGGQLAMAGGEVRGRQGAAVRTTDRAIIRGNHGGASHDQDALGLTLTTQSADAVRAFDHAVDGYLTYRADGMQRLGALLQADPEFGLAHVLKGYFAMLAYKQAAVPMARQEAADAAPHLAGATAREQAHLAALQAWIGEDAKCRGDLGQILRDHPRDIVAFRLAHFVNFWLGGRARC